MVQRLKRVGALSMAKALAVLYAALGLLIGCIFALIAMLAPSIMGGSSTSAGAGGASLMFGMIGGIGGIIILPLVYSIIGFIGGLIGATLYNVVARVMGGIELELE